MLATEETCRAEFEPKGRAVTGLESGADRTRVLVVDDERNIREVLTTALRSSGFSVTSVATASDALNAAASFRPHIMILDVMLPDHDGFAVATRMRSAGDHIPVLFLSARSATADRVAGLGLGDDYVTKPFSLNEVIARLSVILRRVRPDYRTDRNLRYDDLLLCDETGEVWRAGLPIALSPTEFRLLSYLVSNAERAVTKMQILDHVWTYEFDGDRRIVEVYIGYLRRKLDPTGPPLIHTLRTIGYVLRRQPTTAAPGAA